MSPPPKPVWQSLQLQLGLASFAANLVLGAVHTHRAFTAFTGFSFILDLYGTAHLPSRPLSPAIFYLPQSRVGYGSVGRPAASSSTPRCRPSRTRPHCHLPSSALGLLVVLLVALRLPRETLTRRTFLLLSSPYLRKRPRFRRRCVHPAPLLWLRLLLLLDHLLRLLVCFPRRRLLATVPHTHVRHARAVHSQPG